MGSVSREEGTDDVTDDGTQRRWDGGTDQCREEGQDADHDDSAINVKNVKEVVSA